MKKSRFAVIIILVVVAVCFAGASPKWTVQESWQKKIRKGLTERAVTKILGEPKYILRGSRRTSYLYQIEPVIQKNKKSNIPIHKRKLPLSLSVNSRSCGFVIFQHKAKNNAIRGGKNPITKPRMLVDEWKEPDFSKCKNISVEIPVKLKPKCKLEKWQKEKSWSRLAINMSINAVARILGPPQSEKEKSDYTYFYYGDISGFGELCFSKKGQLTFWNEPFWQDIKARLYEPFEKQKEKVQIKEIVTKNEEDGVTYSIINSDTYLDYKRSLDVRLNKKVSEKTLRAIALKLKGQDSRSYKRTFICYLLPGMEVGAGAWATTHFNPNLEVKILGLTVEQENALKQSSDDPSREVIGIWLDESPFIGSRVTIFGKDGKLFMENKYKDGSIGKTEIAEKLSGRKRTFRSKKGSSTGEFYLIDKQGNLQMWDEEGLIYMAKKI